MADPLENREAGSLPRVGRFCVRCRGRLPDRRRGHGHFVRGRLSLVVYTCICMFLPGDESVIIGGQRVQRWITSWAKRKFTFNLANA